MKTLTRAQILSAEDLKSERVKIPEWDGEVIVRELTGTERDHYEASVVKTNGMQVSIDSSNMRAKLVALSCVDKEGARLFTEEDVVALGKKAASALDRIVDVARRLSRIGEEELESLGKPSKSTRSVASASASPGS